MTEDSLKALTGELLTDEVELSFVEVCAACGSSSESIIALAEEGAVNPLGSNVANWRFRIIEVNRIYRALRIQRDLGVNAAGAALALDLLDEIESLRSLLQTYRY